MKKPKKKTHRLTNDSKDDWIELGKEEGENWIKTMSNDDALRWQSMHRILTMPKKP